MNLRLAWLLASAEMSSFSMSRSCCSMAASMRLKSPVIHICTPRWRRANTTEETKQFVHVRLPAMRVDPSSRSESMPVAVLMVAKAVRADFTHLAENHLRKYVQERPDTGLKLRRNNV